LQDLGADSAAAFLPGQPVWLSWKPDAILVLDAE